MKRYAWKAIVKEGMLDEYIRRHDEIWPEIKIVLCRAGIRNYTIWNTGNVLFGYYKCEMLPLQEMCKRKAPWWIIGMNT